MTQLFYYLMHMTVTLMVNLHFGFLKQYGITYFSVTLHTVTQGETAVTYCVTVIKGF